jgi:gluconokinase
VYLKGDYAVFERRLKDRHGHFMKPEMFASQFAPHEEPEEATHLDITRCRQ